MKCPKCGYLGFETSERCRNCGYDFSLAVPQSSTTELPLHAAHDGGSALADFDLHDGDAIADDRPRELDLDRMIGGASASAADGSPALGRDRFDTVSHAPAPSAPDARSAASASARPTSGEPRRAHTSASARNAPISPSAPGAPDNRNLPLFERDDETPLITAPRPARPPLSVRRTTPEIPRTRTRIATPRPEEGELAFPSESASDPDRVTAPVDTRRDVVTLTAAGTARRLLAAAIDLILLGSINAAVVYLTLALTGLSREQLGVLPLLPLVIFFVILDGGYLVAFVAAAGQTIGKMVTGIRVVRTDGRRVEVSGAVLRAVGCGVSLLTAGLGYLPAFVSVDRRALQDRVAGTRVVSAR